jgi:hypothetical protein
MRERGLCRFWGLRDDPAAEDRVEESDRGRVARCHRFVGRYSDGGG